MARRAEGLAAGGPVEPGLAERVGALVGELDEEVADRQLVARLEEIRLLQAEVNVKENRFALERALPEYRQVFKDYGLPPGGAPEAAAARLRGRPGAVRAAVVTALDEWLALARWEKAPEVSWLERVLAAADPDDWRQRVRVARSEGGREALEGLAREVDVAAQPPQALFLLGRALDANGSPEAVPLLRRAQETYPGDFWINQQLGRALIRCQPPQYDEAIRFLTAAVALRPNSAGVHLNLGIALAGKGRRAEAILANHWAIKLKPDYAQAYHNLGVVLDEQGDLTGAAEHLRRATELRPENAASHLHLGVVRMHQKDLPGAADCFRRGLATSTDRDLQAGLHRNLGLALQNQGDWAGAIDHFRRAVALNPGEAPNHYHLGFALSEQGDGPGAAASYRRAVEADPKHAGAHWNLGFVLLFQGEPRAALAELRTGHELGSRLKEWPPTAAQTLQQCERFVELDDRLPALLKGEAQPSGVAERLQLAELCLYKRLYASSVRFWTEAFAADPKLADDFRVGQRYRAAHSAALAGCGQGEEAARLAPGERERLRRQAREWLRADLAAWDRYLKDGTLPDPRPRVLAALGAWQKDPALAGVRDADALAALPPEERAAWQQLWADVAALAAKARDGK
jgi:tetratricopeptide (TPR) repeat protein